MPENKIENFTIVFSGVYFLSCHVCFFNLFFVVFVVNNFAPKSEQVLNFKVWHFIRGKEVTRTSFPFYLTAFHFLSARCDCDWIYIYASWILWKKKKRKNNNRLHLFICRCTIHIQRRLWFLWLGVLCCCCRTLYGNYFRFSLVNQRTKSKEKKIFISKINSVNGLNLSPNLVFSFSNVYFRKSQLNKSESDRNSALNEGEISSWYGLI